MRKKPSLSMYFQLLAALMIAVGIVAYSPNHDGGTAWAQEESKQAETTVVGAEGPDPGNEEVKEQSEEAKGYNTGSKDTDAKLNIATNALEIGLTAASGFYFIGSIICLIRRRFKLAGLLICFFPISIFVGFKAADIIGAIVSASQGSIHSLAPVLMVAGALSALAAFCLGMLLPGIIALREDHSKKWIIFGLCFISWVIPLGWIALMVWTLWAAKNSKRELENIPSPIDFSRRDWNDR